jgi:hypothetical protein
MPGVPVSENGMAIAASALLWLAATVLLLRGRARLAGTTLLAPWAWCLAALGAVSAAEVASAAGGGSAWREPLRYAAAVSSFCPLMAVLGAKRPQDRAWQWIVASLWGVLAIPGIESLLFRPGQPLYVAPAWSWLLLALWLIAALDYLATRFWPSCLLVLAAQWIWLADYLPLPGAMQLAYDFRARLLGLACAAAAVALVAAGLPRRRQRSDSLDRLWLDFRDSYGAAWSLRVAQRLHEMPHQEAARLSPGWFGLLGHEPPTAADRAAIEQSLRPLLARFVSAQWIEQRLK